MDVKVCFRIEISAIQLHCKIIIKREALQIKKFKLHVDSTEKTVNRGGHNNQIKSIKQYAATVSRRSHDDSAGMFSS